jgi:hypothetical protein
LKKTLAEALTLQQYHDIFRKPLSQSAMMAVRKLTEVAQMNKKKKKEPLKKKNGKIEVQGNKEATNMAA